MAEQVIIPKSEKLPGSFKVTIKVRSENTNGVMSVVEETLPPKALVPPHVHKNDVWVYVQTGEIGVLIGETTKTASKGQWALKPRNVQHAMWNSGSVPATVIEVLTPGGTEKWFEEITKLPKGDKKAFKKACGRHAIEFLPDSLWIDRLTKRFKLG
ncbi:MAG TPA: cupin domain-containing protein [Candidatus Saccharimonadales bacterium]|nr:cupin domain-containing protein [Candidatus Saccharimonadales bacterium]